MLILCPECESKVSDRAVACPSCGFPIAEHVARQAEADARAAERASRKLVGEVDCVVCEARGFATFDQQDDLGRTRQVFRWCAVCEHSGRVPLCQSTRGFFAVSYRQLERFLRGEVDVGGDDVHDLGAERPTGHRYPSAGARRPAATQGAGGAGDVPGDGVDRE